MSVKEQVFNPIKNRLEEVNRFRNGYIRQHLTSIDIEKIVKVGGIIIEFFEGFICDNLNYKPFEEFVLDMTAKRNKYKKEKRNILQTQAKKVSIAVYGYSIRSDIEDVYNCVFSHWMKTGYNDRVIEWLAQKNNNLMVKIADLEGVDDNGYSKKINSQPCHFGSIILSQSKKLMNDVINDLKGFKNHKNYYSDIHKNDYEVSKEQILIGKDLYQSKNDYGDAGILYALFMSAKIKYCIVIDDNGLLQQKIIFNGCDREISQIGFEDFPDMEKGLIVRNTSNLNWKRGLLGVKVPHRVINCENCRSDNMCRSCITDPKLNCYDCEKSRSCNKCLKRITQIKVYSTEITKLKDCRLMKMVICYLTMLEKNL